jgi:hypothetical protein
MTRRRRIARRLALLALALPAGTSAAEPCGAALGSGAARVESARYVVAFAPSPSPIAVGRAFAVDAVVCPGPGAPAPTGLRVDALMPDHRHGMNYRTSVAARGAGQFRAEGLLFHMPGRWQILFDVEAGAEIERAAGDVTLE